MKAQLVYFIQAGPDGPVKIGVSEDPSKRLRGLQTANPAPLAFLGIIRGGVQKEQALHAELARYRLSGEWFRPEPKVRERLLRTILLDAMEDADASRVNAVIEKIEALYAAHPDEFPRLTPTPEQQARARAALGLDGDPRGPGSPTTRDLARQVAEASSESAIDRAIDLAETVIREAALPAPARERSA